MGLVADTLDYFSKLVLVAFGFATDTRFALPAGVLAPVDGILLASELGLLTIVGVSKGFLSFTSLT